VAFVYINNVDPRIFIPKITPVSDGHLSSATFSISLPLTDSSLFDVADMAMSPYSDEQNFVSGTH
jgi:hypothetical protein